MHALFRRSRRARRGPRAGALPLLVSVWTALAWCGALAPALGRGPALLLSFGLATAFCAIDLAAGASARSLAARRRRSARPVRGRRRPGRARTGSARPGAAAWRVAGRLLVGVAAGLIVMPGLCVLTAGAGRALGLTPPIVAPPLATWGQLLAHGLLAPFFEEHLYRGRLLPALVPRIGRAGALCATSVLFALPHLEPWAVLGAGLAGLVLGARRLATGRVSDCVALHAGLNGAAWATVGPAAALSPLASLAVAAGGIALLVGPRSLCSISRRVSRRPGGRAGAPRARA
jgi:membrane protease YdiL (CAAX protease family)